MSSNGFWVSCLYPEELGLLPGSKVHLSQCVACPVEGCPRKAEVFAAYFPRSVGLDGSTLNRKIMDLNEKLDAAKKKSDLYCPRKGNLTTRCLGLTSFCRYNTICGRFRERTGRAFIRSVRWRKVMLYVVKFRNGEVRHIEKSALGAIDIDAVEVVYPGTLEVEVVTELVPQGEEQDRFAETVASFSEKYQGKVVAGNGMVPFEEWFAAAATGDRALIPEKALVPVKTYRVVKIKGSDKVKLPVQSPVPAEIAPAPKPVPAPKPPTAPVKLPPVAPPPPPPPEKKKEPVAPPEKKKAGRPPKPVKVEKVEKPAKIPPKEKPGKKTAPPPALPGKKKPVVEQEKLFPEPAKRGRKPGPKKK